jgi:uncharacterized protein
MSVKIFAVIIFILLGVPSHADTTIPFDILTDNKIVMPDGVKLSSTVWIPRLDRKLPAVLIATPYAQIFTQRRAKRLVSSEYVYIAVDVRGRGGSDGQFVPLEESGDDLAAIARWIKQQPWSNGKIAMTGISYNAMLNWKAVKGGAAIDTFMPISPVYPGVDFPKVNNIFMSYTRGWLTLTHGSQYNFWPAFDSDYWDDEYETAYKELRSFREAGTDGMFDLETYNRWLDHPFHDDYWRSMGPSSSAYKNLSVPVLTTTGFFDSDQKGSLRYYREHVANRSKRSPANHYLIIGPWDHKTTMYTSNKAGGLVFGSASVVDIQDVQKQWLDWTLKDKEKPPFLKDKVNYFVMGANKWKSAGSLAEIGRKKKRFYLSSPSVNPYDVFHSGILSSEVPAEQPMDYFTYDPFKNAALRTLSDPLTPDKNGYVLTQELSFKTNSLIYHTPPLTEALTLSGHIRLQVDASLDVDDVDLMAEVSVVMPEGTVHSLVQDRIRARYRSGLDKVDYPVINQKNTYVIDGFNWLSHLLPVGSRLRLVIRASDSTHWQRNYNVKGDSSRLSGKDAKVATVSISLLDSFLEIPVEEDTKQ